MKGKAKRSPSPLATDGEVHAAGTASGGAKPARATASLVATSTASGSHRQEAIESPLAPVASTASQMAATTTKET
eukprot:CAMPEP_0183707436 /NCGR_PEP_ID=MMETSP0737-20130205/4010_1 /TAXON_ID=385413 /ORGANISM="Thalassiosira miniscula, Strain CCMP1093" /LENGTH=74 /DNA_ID=CAMNT_0025935095 /DNA_START=24 /DNA_END=248 /DNA_ORIENTATION=+